MAVDATQGAASPAGTSVTAAIRKASQVTGAKFSYMLATAKVESNLNPNAAAKTSSAGGLYQFIDRTWLGTLKEAGPLLGYSRYADAISRTSDGRYVITDPSMRGEIMALRQDPTANALMAGVFTNSNSKHLTNKLGRPPTDGELYMAHFMGASGAARLITAAENNPGGIAAQSFSGAARANRSIFFDRSGRARSFSEVAQNLAARYETARSRVAGLGGSEPAQGGAFVAETARVARAYQVTDAATRIPAATQTVATQTGVQAAAQRLAQGEPVFHNPYRAGERRQPVATAVADLWAPQSRTTQQEQVRHIAQALEAKSRASAAEPVTQNADARTENAPGSLGLFQDIRPDVRSLFTHGVRG